MINDLSSRQAVNQARELKAGNIKFRIYASDGTSTELDVSRRYCGITELLRLVRSRQGERQG